MNSIYRLLYKIIFRRKLPLSSGRLMIIRTDAIGDYILFRNFLASLKEDNRFAQYKFTLLANQAFKELAEELDHPYIDKFIWIDPSIIYTRSIKSRFLLALKLQLKRFDVIINPIHSRLWEMDEFLASCGGKVLYGSSGDETNFINHDSYTVSSQVYTKLFPVEGVEQFEFLRNRKFFRQLMFPLSQPLPGLNISGVQKYSDTGNYIVVFPGAGEPFRRWSPQHFAQTIKAIEKETGGTFHYIIAGSSNDGKTAGEIVRLVGGTAAVQDKTGHTGLVQLVSLIAGCSLLVSNETSAVHIAAAVNVPGICISNGNHFGRFSPYPQEIARGIFTFYPHKDFYEDASRVRLIEECKKRSDYDINLIDPEDVARKAAKILKTIR